MFAISSVTGGLSTEPMRNLQLRGDQYMCDMCAETAQALD